MPKRGGVVISPNIKRVRQFIDPATGYIIDNPKTKNVVDKNDGGILPMSELMKL